ncbi:MAG: hypothetical protein ACFCD0_21300 [Gemmataceae bacterium]
MHRSFLFGISLVVLAGLSGADLVEAQGRRSGNQFDPLGIGQRSRFGNSNPPFSNDGVVGRGPRLRDPVKPRYDKPSEEYLIKDIQVTPGVGEWMICVMSYSGPQCFKWSREMVIDLRKKYELPAYVYNRGGEKRRAEEDRIRKEIRQFSKHRVPNGVDPETVDPEVTKELLRKAGGYSVRRYWNIPDQTAVLVGAYKDKDTAKKVLRYIEKLPMPNPKTIKLHALYRVSKNSKSKKDADEAWVWQNPFLHSFVCRNPTLPEVEVDEDPNSHIDKKLIRQLNAHDPYSILKTDGNVTFVIAEYQLPVLIEQQTKPKSLVERFDFRGMFVKKRDDSAGASAHSVAKALRGPPLNLDAYVLHLPRSSLVLVGSFRTFDDPKMKLTFDRLNRVVSRFRQVQALSAQNKSNPLGLFPRAKPMVIPR